MVCSRRFKIIRRGASSTGSGRRSSTPSPSATTIVRSIGSTMSTIVDMILLDWNKCGRRNGGPTDNSLSFFSVAEVNCVQARARARKEIPEPMLTFRKNLAMRMLRNKIQSNGLAATSPPRTRERTSSVHMLRKRKTRERKWNHSTHTFNKVRSDYVRYPCSDCKKLIRTYCSCDPGAPLCSICFGLHAQEHGH